MNATPPDCGKMVWNPLGVAVMHAWTAGMAKVALIFPKSSSLKSDATPSGQTLMLFCPELNPRTP